MDEGGRDARKVLVIGGGNEEAGIEGRNGAGNGGRNGEEEEENCRSKLARGVRTRSSGGKDRHTKVITAKGLRDRRVRLSVSTAIQFYDVLDRLGYDQPSKAVEWLIKQAQRSIDELQALPPIPSCTAVVRRSEPTWSDKNLGSSFSQKPLDFIPFSQTRSSDWNLPPHPTHLSIHRSADFHSCLKPPDCSMTVLPKQKEISSDPPPPFLGSISSELNPPRFVPSAQNPTHHSGNNSSSNHASSASAAAAAAPSSASFLELLSNESSLENLLHRSANNPHSHSHTHSHSHAQLFPPRQQAFFGHTPLASVLIPPLQHAMHGYGGPFAPEAPSYPIPSVGFSNLNPNSAPKLQPDPWASRDSFQSLLPSADQQHPKLHSFVLGDSLQSIADPRVHPGSSSFYSFSNPDMNSRGSK